MVPSPVLELDVTVAALGAASRSRLGECFFCAVWTAWHGAGEDSMPARQKKPWPVAVSVDAYQ
jgi:hypothetical protein